MTAIFSKSARNRLQKFEMLSLAHELETHFKNIEGKQVKSVSYGNPLFISENKRARRNLEILKQGLLYRSASLLRAFATLVDGGNVYSLALIARGHLEGTAQLGYFCDRLNALNKKNITFKRFCDIIAQANLASKHSQFEEAPDPVNILTCIQKADLFLKREVDERLDGIISDNYGWMSEFCHPNFLSSKSSYSLDKNNYTMVFRDNCKVSKQDLEPLKYLSSSDLRPKYPPV